MRSAPDSSLHPVLRAGLVGIFSAILLSSGLLSSGCRGQRPGQRSDNSGPVLEPPPSHPATAVTSYSDVVAKVAPAVVTIRSERRVRAPRQFPFFNDPFFRDLFGENVRPPQPQLQMGLGSGVLVTHDGYLLTNHHVIDGADEIQVETAGGRTYRVKVVGSDAPSDLAVLRIDGNNLPMLRLGDSDKVRVGDVVLAVGNPLGVGQTVTAGIISAKERSTGTGNGTYESFLQTDAPINRGNSGGALVNTAGELIGINSQILSTSGGGSIGIGFAIPSNMARQVSEQLIKSGSVRRGKLGVTIQPLTPDMASSLGLKDTQGVIVSSVEPGGPAERAGAQTGDVITQLNGTPVRDGNQFRNAIAGIAPGTEVTITVIRGGQQQQLRLKLEELGVAGNSGGEQGGRGSQEQPGRFGMTVSPLTPDMARQLGVRSGTTGVVVTDIDPVGSAAEAGIQQGDVIVQANGNAVRNVDDLRNALSKSTNTPALLLVQRQQNQFYVTIRPQ
jgi:serine protease Do